MKIWLQATVEIFTSGTKINFNEKSRSDYLVKAKFPLGGSKEDWVTLFYLSPKTVERPYF